MKMEFVNMCQEKAERNRAINNAIKYSKRVAREKRITKVKGILALSFLFILACVVGQMDYETYAKEIETEQQYIVRYGVTYEWGSEIITEDGNMWTLTDAPEYEDGTEVRVLFDSKETEQVEDDVIIDITEK